VQREEALLAKKVSKKKKREFGRLLIEFFCLICMGKDLITTNPSSSLECPEIVFPADGRNVNASSLSLSWKSKDGTLEACGYLLYLKSKHSSEYINEGTVILDTSYDVELEWGGSYEWKLLPYRMTGEPLDCPTYTFTTEIPTPSRDYVLVAFAALIVLLSVTSIGSYFSVSVRAHKDKERIMAKYTEQ
jgi:hypothetical protein